LSCTELMSCLKVLNSYWEKLWTRVPLYYFPPLGDLNTFAIILVQCLWSYAVFNWELWSKEDGTDLDYSTSTVVTTLVGTLAFILPLNLSAALSKNSSCLNNYNAFAGDIIALAWDTIAFKGRDNSDQNVRIMMDILVALPALVKHSFRGTLDLEKSTTRDNQPFSDTQGGKEVTTMFNKTPDGMSVVDICFFKLLDYQKDLTQNKISPLNTAAQKSWERAYSSWGNMGSLSTYNPPVLFTYVLNVALFLYIGLIPFTLKSQQIHVVWQTGLIAYFFFGLNLAGSKVGNAFAEGAQGFQTVTGAQKSATKALEQIWMSRASVYKGGSNNPNKFWNEVDLKYV